MPPAQRTCLVMSEVFELRILCAASLNPTYTYGKRPTPSNSSSGAVSGQGRSLRRSTTPVDTLVRSCIQQSAPERQWDTALLLQFLTAFHGRYRHACAQDFQAPGAYCSRQIQSRASKGLTRVHGRIMTLSVLHENA